MRNHTSASSFSPSAPRMITLGLVALAVGSLADWALRLGSMPTTEAGLRFVSIHAPEAAPQDLARALGAARSEATPSVAAPRSSLTLAGVIATGANAGMALIAVDGQKAQTFELGQEVQPGVYLIGVGPRLARLGATPQGPVTEVLEIVPPTLPQNQ